MFANTLTRRNAMLLLGTAAASMALPSVSRAQEAPKASGTVDMAELLKEGSLEDKFKGDPNAPLTIVEYASATCGHCANFHNDTFPEIDKKYIQTGKVKFIMREFALDARSAAGFMLARCAPNDAYFPMLEVLFKQQRSWAFVENARTPLENIAKLAGFTQESFNACLTDQALLENVNKVRDRASKDFGVDATPTFFIDGKRYAGALNIDQMSAIIDPLLG